MSRPVVHWTDVAAELLSELMGVDRPAVAADPAPARRAPGVRVVSTGDGLDHPAMCSQGLCATRGPDVAHRHVPVVLVPRGDPDLPRDPDTLPLTWALQRDDEISPDGSQLVYAPTVAVGVGSSGAHLSLDEAEDVVRAMCVLIDEGWSDRGAGRGDPLSAERGVPDAHRSAAPATEDAGARVSPVVDQPSSTATGPDSVSATPRPVLRATGNGAMAGGGSVSYTVAVDGRWIGWVLDEREWRGSGYGPRHWFSCHREDGDQHARWTSPSCRTRAEAVAALVARATGPDRTP